MTSAEELIPVREAHRFDEAALAEYLRAHIDGFSGDLTILQFENGQSNPTFLLTAGGQEYVLRKKPPGKLLPTAHMVDREYRIITALRDTDVPVPKTYVLCEDDSVIGTAFYVMEYVRGRLIEDVTLKDFTPKERYKIYEDMNRVMAALHTVDYEALGLTDFGKPGSYFERQYRRWTKQWEAAKTHEIPSMDRLIEWLPDNMPEDDTTCIVHGDFRLGNSLIHPTEPRIVAMLDWELSTLGHPLADLSYNCNLYHVDLPNSAGLRDLVGSEYGIPTEKEYVAMYCRRTGRNRIPRWNFYVAFSFFRLASIVQGVYARGLQGIASSSQALERGSYAAVFADKAWELAQQVD
ncbi:MAG: phosphotransferase [Proteobacteria bacterium]|nr:phosphotransferase [Pseudomonadota bacterium]